MQLQIYKHTTDSISTRTAFFKFFKEAYKIRVTIVVSAFARLIIEHFLLD